MAPVLLTLMSLLLGSTAFAQSPTGDIQGTVTDSSGAVLTKAKVIIIETATGRTIETTSNDAGLYTAFHLLPGDYTVKVEKEGFASFSEKVEVRAGQVASVSPKMKVGSTATTVEVTGTGLVIPDLTRSTIDGVIEAEQIQNLPANQRNFLELAALEPGVFVRDGGAIDPTKSITYRTVGVDGRSGTSTRVQVDGIDITDETVGTTLSNVSNDAVKEFQLSQSTLDLSTSLTSSGAVNIITKSGGNQIHGAGFEFFRDNNMEARVGDQLSSQAFRRHQYGFNAGGPFIKDKLFWFVNGEHLSQLALDPTTISKAGPPFSNFFGKSCANGCAAGTPLDVKLGDARMDWNATSNLRVLYRFNYSSDLAAGGSVPFSPFQNVDWTTVHTLGVDYGNGRFSHSYRFGYVNFHNRIVSQEFAGFAFPVAPTGQPYNLSIVNGNGVSLLTVGPNGLAPQQTDQNNFQNKYDGSFIFGKHALRYGFEFNHIVLGGFANFAGPLSVSGTFAANSTEPNPLNYPLQDFSTGPDDGFFTVGGCFGFQHGCHRNNRIAWYVGDSWKKFSNFTFNYGTRWEFDTGYLNQEGSNGVHRPSFLDFFLPGTSKTPSFPKTAFSPQLGFAWDPWKDGKTSIRGGAYLAYEMNIFNNLLFDQSALIPSGIGPDTFTSAHVAGPDGSPITPALAGINVASLPVSCQGSTAAMNAGDYSCLVGNPIGSTLAAIGALDKKLKALYQAFTFNPASGSSQFLNTLGNTLGPLIGGNNFKPPYATQLNIGFERELTRNNVLSVDFLFNHGVHQGFLSQDFECRRCANTLNAAAAQTQVNKVLTKAGVATVDQWMLANPTKTITSFGLNSDSIFQGRTPDPAAADAIIQTTNFLRANIVGDGGFTKYRALNVKLRGRLNQTFLHALKNSVYQLSYAYSLSQATNASNRTEFLNTARDKADPTNSAYFGADGLDHRHNLAASLTTQVPFGFHIGQIWSFRSAPPLNLFMPAIGIVGSNQLFTTDMLGEGGTGTTPLGQVVPGTTLGAFGRSINSWSDLNAIITAYNNNGAGKLTPAGQALVNAGIFTQAQLVALKAVTPTIPLVPTTNPWPFENFFNLDMTLSRPIKLTRLREGMELEPIAQAFNLFNNNSRGTYGGVLDGSFGSLNFDYNSPLNNASQTCAVTNTLTGSSVQNCMKALELSRARTNINRVFQIGVRLNF